MLVWINCWFSRIDSPFYIQFSSVQTCSHCPSCQTKLELDINVFTTPNCVCARCMWLTCRSNLIITLWPVHNQLFFLFIYHFSQFYYLITHSGYSFLLRIYSNYYIFIHFVVILENTTCNWIPKWWDVADTGYIIH